jgi:hypothetical protein
LFVGTELMLLCHVFFCFTDSISDVSAEFAAESDDLTDHAQVRTTHISAVHAEQTCECSQCLSCFSQKSSPTKHSRFVNKLRQIIMQIG